jgi:hypothetical protein
MRNDQAYCTLYIPFKKTPPTIEMGEMGFKTSSAPQKPSEHVFFSKSFLVLRKSKGGFCEYMAPLSTFNYKCVDKKSYKFISSSEEGDKYKISDSEKESLIKELTAIKKTIEESLKKFEPADEKTISPIFNQ